MNTLRNPLGNEIFSIYNVRTQERKSEQGRCAIRMNSHQFDFVLFRKIAAETTQIIFDIY